MSAVTVRNLTKTFGSTEVLRGIDLTVAQESVTAILGPSGCGKTTLLRLIAGFDTPDSGEILFSGQLVCGGNRFVGPQHRRVGYVPQEGALFPHLDVAHNITFGLRGGNGEVVTGSRSCWRWWASRPGLGASSRTSFPVVCSSEWPWLGPWRLAPP